MTSAVPGPTFRDPDGSLVLHGDHAIRTIHPAARQTVLQFLESPFHLRLQPRGDIVGTTIDDSPAGLRLLHPRIPIPTYPWEWTPSQWLAAAELTLDLCAEALAEGWVLKDATPLNILFIGSRPVLVDVLSFDRRDPSTYVWLANGQYIRTFLLPLVMHRLLHWPLAFSLFRRDGYEPSELFAFLSWPQRLSRAAFWPITIPAWFERKSAAAPAPKTTARPQNPEVALDVMQRMLKSLHRRTQRAIPKMAASSWSDYSSTLTHYTAEQSQQKRAWMQQTLAAIQPTRALDIGANTGEYSALIAETGVEVVALERDAASAERIFLMSRQRNLPIHTIHADLARPTPAAGWDNNESSALLPRLEAQFDLVLMLAVIHHLLLLEQIPLAAIVALCHRLTRRHLVIEWVPVSDPMFRELMRGREDLYGALTDADLLAACANLFHLVQQHTLDNGRILFLFEKMV
jgi:SAM-dependent methyltransferase